MVLGISGVAGSGKDTFFSILSAKIDCKRYSLADELKREVQPWCMEHYDIDSFDCSRKEKEIIRPFLVFHGLQKRNATNGRYWIEKISNKILNSKENNKIITDIRFDDYENDEVSWLKDELGGVLVHISQFSTPPPSRWSSLSVEKEYKEPANSEEARNNPKLKEKADFLIEWPILESTQDIEEELSPYVDEFIAWQPLLK